MVDIAGNVNPTFHVVFREIDGTPLIGGSVYWYKASDHSTLKAVYEDRPRTIPLPNPTPLNNAGVVSDATGAPKPVYLSDDENYYVAVYRAGESPPIDIPIQTVDDWNADAAFNVKPQVDEIVTTNFIPNAQFRSLINGKTNYTSAELNAANNVLIARNNWYLRRDVLASTNTLEFKEFIVGQTDVPFNPKYYLNFACSVVSTETIKDITVDIGDVETFSNQEMTFAIYAKSSTISQIEILTDQDFGSGGSSQVITVVDSIQLTTAWTQYNTTFTTADVSGKTVGTDNKFRIRVRVPLNAICNVDFVMCQLNIGDTVLEFDYQASIDNDGNASKDAIPQPIVGDAFKNLTIDSDNITNVWRSAPPIGTVDWLAAFTVPPGYLKCNGATYSGLPDSPYKGLYDVIRNIWGYGEDGFVNFTNLTRYISGFVNKFDTNVTDIADTSTGFTFSTSEQGGDKGFLASFYLDLAGVVITNKNNGNVTDTAVGTSGFTVTKIQEGTGSLPEISRIETTAASGLAGKYFLISSTTTDYYVWFQVDGAGADPAVGGRTGIKISLNSSALQQDVTEAVYYTLRGCEHYFITCNAASTLTGGEYFSIYNSSDTFIIWYRVGGVGTEPVVAGTKVVVDLLGSDTDVGVAGNTRDALNSIKFKVPDLRGAFIRGWDEGRGLDPDRLNRGQITTSFQFGDNVGTYQEDEFKTHAHQFTPFNRTNAVGATGMLWAGIPPAGTATTTSIGGNETRPKNYYLMPIIKY
jgi:hypothetical protein